MSACSSFGTATDSGSYPFNVFRCSRSSDTASRFCLFVTEAVVRNFSTQFLCCDEEPFHVSQCQNAV
jgi:hypothetical protein